MKNAESSHAVTDDAPCHEFMDSLMQSLFGIGLRLDSCIDVAGQPQLVRDEIDQSLHALHRIIGDITEHRGANCLRDDASETGNKR